MAFLILLCSFMAIGPYAIIATPVPVQNTLYNAINSSCSSASELLTKQKEIFANCQNVLNIDQPTLTNDNAQQVLCLLYYNRIISYCQTKPRQFEYPTLAEVISKNYTLPDICKNITKYSNGTIKEYACYHLCTGLVDNDINPKCLLSHYYNTLINNASASITNPYVMVTPVSNTEIGPASNPILPNQLGRETVVNKENPVKQHKPPKEVNQVQGGDSDTIDNKTPTKKDKANEQKQSVVDGSNHNNEAEIKPNKVDEHKKGEVEGQLSDNKPLITSTKGQTSVVQSPIQNAPVEHASHSEHLKPVTEKVVSSHQDVPVELSPQKKPTAPKSVQKPTVNVQSELKDTGATNMVADKPTGSEIKPKLANDNIDIDDEGQHGDPDAGDYNGLPDGQSISDETIPQLPSAVEVKPNSEMKPDTLQGSPINTDNIDEINGESYFMTYFMVVCVLVVLGYVGYHNRIKVMALLLEGKRNRRPYRGRRPNSANYHKLDSNLEEAISSNVTKNSNNVIY